MADYQQRDMSGILFCNDKKQKESHPDYRGSCMVDGYEYYMDAWNKKGKRGTFMSFSFKSKTKPDVPAPKVPATGGGIADMESDIPF